MISVIWVAFRTPIKLLELSIASVRKAALVYGEELDLIIIDNGGEVDYRELGGGVRIIGDGSNIGFGGAVNKAVRAARGERVLMMNPDSVVCADIFRELSVVDVIGTNTLTGALLIKEDRVQVHAYNLWWSSISLALLKRKWRILLNKVVETGVPTRVDRLCGAGLFAGRDTLAELGPFDESFFLYGEDVDLSLRAKRAGYRLLLVPKAIVLHDAGTSSEGSSALVERARTDAHFRLVSRYRGRAISILARLESVVATVVGFALARGGSSRLARFKEIRRWGWRRDVPPFDPATVR